MHGWLQSHTAQDQGRGLKTQDEGQGKSQNLKGQGQGQKMWP